MKIIIITADGSERKADLCSECVLKNMPQHTPCILSSKRAYDNTRKSALFIDESSIIDHDIFWSSFIKIHPHAKDRANWYYQQFVKMRYAVCGNESEYVVFDCDTMPLRDIPFKNGEKYLFNRKTEHHLPYFNTMRRLFGEMNVEHSSFISEYMVFDSGIMNEIIEKISDVDRTCSWYENVLNAIDCVDVAQSGFSEYETYGTYMNTFHGNRFENISLSTNRCGRTLFDGIPSYDEIMRYSNSYDTISIEDW